MPVADDNPTATASDLSTVSITITDDDTGATTSSRRDRQQRRPDGHVSGARRSTRARPRSIHVHRHRPRQRHVPGRHDQLRPQRHHVPTAWPPAASPDGTFDACSPTTTRRARGRPRRSASRSPTATPANNRLQDRDHRQRRPDGRRQRRRPGRASARPSRHTLSPRPTRATTRSRPERPVAAHRQLRPRQPGLQQRHR